MKPGRIWIIATLISILPVITFIAARQYGLWFNKPGQTYRIRGIDVSNHQGYINWQEVSKTDIRFAYIKATEGGDFVDRSFQANWEGIAGTKLRRGAYHYFTLCRDGRTQAANFISVVPQDANSLPPAIDLEFTGNCSARPDTMAFKNELDLFISELERHYGRKPVLYITEDFYRAYLDNKYHGFDFWIRNIFGKPGGHLPEFVIWQYSEFEVLPGIEGNVDINVMTDEFWNRLTVGRTHL